MWLDLKEENDSLIILLKDIVRVLEWEDTRNYEGMISRIKDVLNGKH